MAPVPLGLIKVLNWVGLGWGWAQGVGGLRARGQGLTKTYFDRIQLDFDPTVLILSRLSFAAC